MKKLLLIGLFMLLSVSLVFAAEWTTNVAYKVGDNVTYLGKTYQCLQAHTSQAAWTPVAVPALWKEITVTTTTVPVTTTTLPPTTTTLPPTTTTQPITTTTIAVTTTTTPATTTTTTLRQISEWKVGIAYRVNDEVTYSTKNYQCLQAHTSQADWTPPAVPALWKLKLALIQDGSWQIGVPYRINDKVIYRNVSYVVRQSHTSQADWTPDITPALFMANVPVSYTTDLITKVQTEYASQLDGWDVIDVDASVKVITYVITVKNPKNGEIKTITWLDSN
jgi:cation transport regulator ChaC